MGLGVRIQGVWLRGVAASGPGGFLEMCLEGQETPRGHITYLIILIVKLLTKSP